MSDKVHRDRAAQQAWLEEPSVVARLQVEQGWIARFDPLVMSLLEMVRLRFFPQGEIFRSDRPGAGVVARWSLFSPEPLRQVFYQATGAYYKDELVVELLARAADPRAALRAAPGDGQVELLQLTDDEWITVRLPAEDGQPYFRCTLRRLRGDLRWTCEANREELQWTLRTMLARKFNLLP